MFKRKKKETINKHQFIQCLDGKNVFERSGLKRHFSDIKALISCPDDVLHQLYFTTLHGLAEFCQAMPFSAEKYNHPYGLLERQLKLAIAALKLRQGVLLPKNAGTETISAEESQWTYAIFSVALLHGIDKVESDRDIQFYFENGEPSGTWTPLAGSLYEENFYYDMKFKAVEAIAKKDVFMAAVIGRIVPVIAFRWLAENKVLFKQWWDSLLLPSQNDIGLLVEAAANKSGIHLSTNEIVLDSLNIFGKWLIKNIDICPENLFRIKKGIFVSSSLVDDFITERQAITGILLSKQIFFQELDKQNGLIMNNHDYFHQLSPKKFEDRRQLNGIVLNIDFLPNELQMLPIDQQFQNNVLL
ncbi:MAG: TraI domain-containing protein [Gammaproteobacteria bacterium]